MKKNSLFMLLVAVLTFLSPSAIKAQTWSATWPFDLGTAGQVATLSDANLFSLNVVSLGSNLSYYSAKTAFNTTFTLIQPSAQASGVAETDAVTFSITPQKGLAFTPTAVSFDAVRFGTDGGSMDVYLKSGDQSKQLDSAFKPNRDNSSDASHLNYTVDGITTSDAISLVVYIYSLANNKQVGLANVSISGTYTGEPEEVVTYTFSTLVSPEGAATIAQSPIGNSFNEGTSIALSVTENLGYDFVNWTDDSGASVSNEPNFSYVLNKNVVLTANFATVETYSLNVEVVGGANDYMVSLSPEATIVDGNNMYEAGTNVMLTASDNPILTFTHWSTGETSKEISVKMDGDKNITANYDAVDYIVGWDFYNSGNSSRIADFYSEGNDATSLVLRDANGNITSWLDKSMVADGGYEGMPAAVNWKTGGIGNYYFQTMINAEAFTQISVTSSMLYNYNAYQKVNVDYSVNGTEWTTVGTFYMQTNKVWYTETFTLPDVANNQAQLYIRWIADTSSEIAGTSSDNDGTSISAIYIVGTKQIIDDGTAPVLVSQVPEEGATNASISGKIVLTFDEKVQVLDDAIATLGDKSITPTATGKTVTCEYSGLEYTREYTFTLPAGTVADLSGNATTEDITINFTTKTRPVVEKGSFDFIVPTDGSFADAVAAATKRSDTNERFRIFVKKGSYLLEGDGGTNTGSDDVTYTQPTTNINTPNISIIGEDRDSTILYNKATAVMEGLGKCQLIYFQSSVKNAYLQDITLKNGLPDGDGRGAALEDAGDKNICKNVCLYGYQDTYYSRSSNRYYFEGGVLRGRTDFLCGRGDIFFNEVELVMCASGGYVTAPSIPLKYGYVFKDCTIKGETSSVNGNYTLGRPWGNGTPICIYINTVMEAQPSATGWNEMSGGYPARFAEYNSVTASGTTIDLSSRKTTFGDGYSNNPILTAAEAAEYTIENVMGSDDDWDPTYYTEQATVPTLSGSENQLSWDENNYAFCFAICKNGSVIDFTTETTYTIAEANEGDIFTVRAANEMGGLSTASNGYAATAVSGINAVKADSSPVSVEIYNTMGVRINVPTQGVNIKRTLMDDGSTVVEKVLVP